MYDMFIYIYISIYYNNNIYINIPNELVYIYIICCDIVNPSVYLHHRGMSSHAIIIMRQQTKNMREVAMCEALTCVRWISDELTSKWLVWQCILTCKMTVTATMEINDVKRESRNSPLFWLRCKCSAHDLWDLQKPHVSAQLLVFSDSSLKKINLIQDW